MWITFRLWYLSKQTMYTNSFWSHFSVFSRWGMTNTSRLNTMSVYTHWLFSWSCHQLLKSAHRQRLLDDEHALRQIRRNILRKKTINLFFFRRDIPSVLRQNIRKNKTGLLCRRCFLESSDGFRILPRLSRRARLSLCTKGKPCLPVRQQNTHQYTT